MDIIGQVIYEDDKVIGRLSYNNPKFGCKIADMVYILAQKPPNWWWRMWQYLLLGWKWTEIK